MSANWNLPILSSLYVDVLSILKDRDVDALTLQITPGSNVPNGAFMFDRVNNYFSEWNGTIYVPKILSIEGGGTGASSVAGAIGSFGLGTMSVQNSNAVTITGGNITGLTNLGTVNLTVTGSVVFPANSIAESMIADGAILARVAANENITGNWTTSGNWNITSGNWTFAGNWSQTSGTFVHSSSVAAKFSSVNGITIEQAVNVILMFQATSAIVDGRKWKFAQNTNFFSLYAANDAESLHKQVFSIERLVSFTLGPFIFGTDVPSVVFPNGSTTVPSIRFINNSTHGICSSLLAATGENAVTITANSGEGIHKFGKWAYEQWSIFPSILFRETDGPVDAKVWQTYVNGGTYQFRTLNDAASDSRVIFTVTRTGVVPVGKFECQINFPNNIPVSFGTGAAAAIYSDDGGASLYIIVSNALHVLVAPYGIVHYKPVVAPVWTTGPALSFKFFGYDYEGITHIGGDKIAIGAGWSTTSDGPAISGGAGPGAVIHLIRGAAANGTDGQFKVWISRYGTGSKPTLIMNYDNTYLQTHFLAQNDNTYLLGYTGNRWFAVYAANGTIQTSDATLKHEIKPINRGLDFINSLEPIQYRWKPIEAGELQDSELKRIRENEDKVHFGFSGQDLHKKLPFANGLVHDEGTGVNYSQFIAFLVKSIQELSAEVDKLKKQ